MSIYRDFRLVSFERFSDFSRDRCTISGVDKGILRRNFFSIYRSYKAPVSRWSLLSPHRGPRAWPNFFPRSFCRTQVPAKFEAPVAPGRVRTGRTTLCFIYIDCLFLPFNVISCKTTLFKKISTSHTAK